MMKFNLISLNCRYSHSCLSLYYLRQELRANIAGCQITINEYTINDPYYKLLTQITTQAADAVFFSVYIWNHELTEKLIKDLSLVRPETPIIIGGPQAPSILGGKLPQQCTLFKGEIESAPAAFYRDLRANKPKACYQAEGFGDFKSPYNDKDFSASLKNRNIYYESSRGCPFSCSYCLSANEDGLRHLSLDQVKEELKLILATKPRIIRFIDRTFNADRKRAMDLWQFLMENGGNTCFHFEIAPDLFTEEMFQLLAKCKNGQFQFEIGVQSTNKKTLAAINRKTDLERSKENIKRLLDLNNIHLHLDLILGLPEEGRADFARSFNEIFQLQPHYIQMGLLKILPHTPISKHIAKYDIKYCQQPPYQVLATSRLSHENLTELYWFGECVEDFYNNRFFPSFFTLINKTSDGFSFFSDLMQICQEQDFFDMAKTQEKMSSLLAILAEKQENKQVLLELLRYDWLRTGHRFLPKHLATEDLKETSQLLWQKLPDDSPPHYQAKDRNHFFKKAMFSHFSPKTFTALGITEPENRAICFLAEREDTPMSLHRIILF